MRRTLWTAALAWAIAFALAVPALAVPPETSTIPFSGVIEGHVEDCDLNLRWEVNGTATRTVFFDADGNTVRFQDRVRELNTITNLDTGETLQEGPDSFLQRTLFNDDGTMTVEISGLSVLVAAGEDAVVDAGRVVLLRGTPDEPQLLHISGRHDVRGIDPFTTSDPILLAGFCGAFA